MNQLNTEKHEPTTAYEDAHLLMKEQIKKALEGSQPIDEDEKYDYGLECQEVYLNRKRTNTFFEEIGFRKDAKNALVYTNEEKLKK